jgi:spore germination cell wall hydrolase CwlJ-like protein
MSISKRAAVTAALTFSFAAAASLVPASTAFGATVSTDTPSRTALTLPIVDLEPDYPHIALPDPVRSAPTGGESLASLVRTHATAEASESELRCLATAVYFESKGEPLAGQLAVAQVVMNRARSGRFASTLCGVVKQPSQFSFVRGGGFPAVVSAASWREAVGVAQVAMKGLHKGPAAGALFFHAKRVSPGWGKRPVASVGNHIFYR